MAIGPIVAARPLRGQLPSRRGLHRIRRILAPVYIGTTKWCRLPEGLSAHRPQLLLQLRILVAELLVLELQLSDPAPQLLGIVIGPTRRRSLRPRLAFTRRTPCHESAYKHTLATMESVFFARQRRHALNVYVGGATTSSVAHQFTVVFAEGPRTAA
jgi:hypothetical protein